VTTALTAFLPDAQERAARVRATRAAMDEAGLDALLLASPENLYYLTGLNHYGYFATTLLLVARDGPPQLVARAMERPTLRTQVPDCVHALYAEDADPADVTARALLSVVTATGRVGLEQDSMYLPVGLWRRLDAALPGIDWVDCTALLATQRAVKSPAEVAHLQDAAGMSDRALQAGIAATRAGVSQRSVASTIYRELIDAGSDAPAFPPFIRASEDIPQEHVTWRDDRPLRRGDRVFFELGASAARYHAPISRIVYVGVKPAGVDAAAEIVLAGLDAIRASLRPGALAGEVYSAWHQAVAGGLGDDGYHRHHCGYLTGLGFPPSCVGGSAVVGLRRGSDLLVQEGMVFHVMSWLLGQALPDYGVSDTAVVTGDGCQLLTSTPRTPHVTAS
jgi:Xaa-Pro dipeptidase